MGALCVAVVAFEFIFWIARRWWLILGRWASVDVDWRRVLSQRHFPSSV